MTQISLPSGNIIDFGNLSDTEIENALDQMRQEDPDLFEAPVLSEEEKIANMTFEEARAYGKSKLGQESDEESEGKVSNEGEVKDLGLQYYVGRGDTDEERQLRLSNVFGEEGVIKLGTDDFALNLDNIAPEIKQQYGS